MTVMKKLNEAQKIAARIYDDGDYAYLVDEPIPVSDWKNELESVGDTLFMFLMIELDDAEDCMDLEEASDRMATAHRQITAVQEAIEAARMTEAA